MAKRPVAVVIGGERYVIKSDADETYVRTLGAYVNEKLQEVRRSARGLPAHKMLILSALNITDELLQERRQQAEIKRRVREKSQSILAQLDKLGKKQKRSRR